MAKTQNLSEEENEFAPVQFSKEIQPQRESSASNLKDSKAEVADTFQLSVYGTEGRTSGSEQSLFSPRTADKPQNSMLPPNFWANSVVDDTFSAEVEKIILWEVEKRVQNVLGTKISELEALYVEPKQKEGFERGYSDGKKKADDELRDLQAEMVVQLEKIKTHFLEHIDTFLQQKQSLLAQHQAHWIETLSLLMKKFLIRDSGRIESTIQNWLQMQVANYKASERVRFFVSEAEFERLKKLNFADLPSHCEFLKDSSLKEGEVKVETLSGGMFFSAETEMKKLEEMLIQIRQSETQSA